MTTVIRDGEFEATINLDEIEQSLRRAGNDAEAAIIRDLSRRGRRIYEAAKAGWPVGRRRPGDARPHSRDMLQHKTSISAATGEIEVTVGNAADYARFIRSAKAREAASRIRPDGLKVGSAAYNKGDPTWLFLRWPEAWHAKDAVKTLRDEIERALRRGL